MNERRSDEGNSMTLLTQIIVVSLEILWIHIKLCVLKLRYNALFAFKRMRKS